MAQRIKHRRDTAVNWASGNPVLADGEIAIDKTNKIIRVGDGVLNYSALPFVKLDSSLGLLAGSAFVPIAIAINSSNIVSTGLGNNVAPDLVQYWLSCVTAANGYAVGDRVYQFVTSNFSIALNLANGNLNFAMGSGLPTIVPNGGGAPVAIVAANYRMNFRCFKFS